LGLVLESDAALRLSDLTRHPAFTGFPPGHPEMKHLLIVPIRVREKAYGQVYLADRQDGAPFSEADEAVVRSFTASVGLLLANVQAQKEQERLQQQFFQAQKMESVGRLAAGVAHDFNNLLTVIGGFTELLLARFPAEDPAHGQLEQVLAAAQRAAGLTRQLLAFSRQQVVVPRVLEVNQVVRDLAKMLVRLLGEDVELVTRLAPGVHPICADPGQLEMVLMNLAVNARDAMPEGGRLVLETANVSLDEAYARSHPDAQPGEHVVLTVSDTGCGMSEEVKAHCFEPFFTTKELGKGTGLGLATVYGIVRQCGGHITVDSQPGQGTTFRLYFPATASSAPVLPSRAVRVAPRPGGGETILVVEDEEGLRRLIGPALEGVGYRVLLAPDAANGPAPCGNRRDPGGFVADGCGVAPNGRLGVGRTTAGPPAGGQSAFHVRLLGPHHLAAKSPGTRPPLSAQALYDQRTSGKGARGAGRSPGGGTSPLRKREPAPLAAGVAVLEHPASPAPAPAPNRAGG
jgi:signal transduction histidine kinase